MRTIGLAQRSQRSRLPAGSVGQSVHFDLDLYALQVLAAIHLGDNAFAGGGNRQWAEHNSDYS